MIKAKEKSETYAQSVYMTTGRTYDGQGVLDKHMPATYETYRKIRKNPTIAFARMLAAAPVISSDWSVKADEDADEEISAYVQRFILPLRRKFIWNAVLFGNIDYGWSPFEVVYGIKEHGGRSYVVVKRLKPLLVDITEILVDIATGEFEGFRQQPTAYSTPQASGYIEVYKPYVLLANMGVEGSNLYGEGLLENVRKSYLGWENATIGAERFDMKMAGNLWVVHYPPGESTYGGTKQDNLTTAKAIIASLESSGSVAVPRQVVRTINELNAASNTNAWDIELKDSTPKQASFVERMNYLDKMSVRGMLIPERMALEGEYGTKADAGVHANMAIVIRQIEHEEFTAQFNEQIVDPLLVENFGEEAAGMVSVEAAPLVDEKLAYFRTIYERVLSDPTQSIRAFENIDVDALMDSLGVPKSRTEAAIVEPEPVGGGTLSVSSELNQRMRELWADAHADSAAG